MGGIAATVPVMLLTARAVYSGTVLVCLFTDLLPPLHWDRPKQIHRTTKSKRCIIRFVLSAPIGEMEVVEYLTPQKGDSVVGGALSVSIKYGLSFLHRVKEVLSCPQKPGKIVFPQPATGELPITPETESS